ncbi:MAG: hypothetical protein AB7F89_12360 [Pirellulaceae bacterium]
MARREQDREDILREATALVERVEFQLPGSPDPIVVGFRRNGCASFFVGADPVIQFNSHGELRRMYFEGRLVKAMRGQLHRIERVRTEHKVELRSRLLSEAEQDDVRQRVGEQLDRIAAAVRSGTVTQVREVPENAAVLTRALAWLDGRRPDLPIAGEPHAR